jgi:alpha-N-acetylglucosaminidase
VLQGWQGNPSGELLKGLDKSKTLVIELFGESTNNWETRRGYENTPFVWSNVSNFGEKTGLYGKLQRFANEVYRAKNSPFGSCLAGIGIIPEGIDNNPVAYDLMLELAWHSDKVDVKEWIKNYTRYRYGKSTRAVDKAWQLFLETVYSSPEVYQEGPSESIFCARPSVAVKSVSSWGTRNRNYDTSRFEEAVRLFESASDEFAQSETYQVDKIDFERQLRANKGDAVYQEMVSAIRNNEKEAFKRASHLFLQMIRQQDSLLSGSSYFSLNKWLGKANDFGKTSAERSISIKNAKTQITYWGPDNPATALHDYAHKEWSGLLSTLYLARWEAFVEEMIGRMNGRAARDIDYFGMEKDWAGGLAPNCSPGLLFVHVN